MQPKLNFRCKYCHAKLKVSLSKSGERLPCPNCGCDVDIPLLEAAMPQDLDLAVPPFPIRETDTAQRKSPPLIRLVTEPAYHRVRSISNLIRGSRKWSVIVFTIGAIVLVGVTATIFALVKPLGSSVAEPPFTRLANKIRPIEDERLEDPKFVGNLTMINDHLITRIRTLAIAEDFQFDESYLGHCDEELTTVVFERPEATYFIDGQTNHDHSFKGYLYPDSSDMCISLPISRSKLRDGHVIVADVESTKQAFRHGGLATALLLEPDPAKQSDVKRSVSALLNSPEVDRVLDSAIRGTEIDITFECGSVSCQIWTLGSANLRFRRLRK